MVVIIGGGVAMVSAEIADGVAAIVNGAGVPAAAAADSVAAALLREIRCPARREVGEALATVMGDGVAIPSSSGVALTAG